MFRIQSHDPAQSHLESRASRAQRCAAVAAGGSGLLRWAAVIGLALGSGFGLRLQGSNLRVSITFWWDVATFSLHLLSFASGVKSKKWFLIKQTKND